jgi:hypothetical protein
MLKTLLLPLISDDLIFKGESEPPKRCHTNAVTLSLDVADHCHELLSRDHDKLVVISLFLKELRPQVWIRSIRHTSHQRIDIFQRQVVVSDQFVVVRVVVNEGDILLEVLKHSIM